MAINTPAPDPLRGLGQVMDEISKHSHHWGLQVSPRGFMLAHYNLNGSRHHLHVDGGKGTPYCPQCNSATRRLTTIAYLNDEVWPSQFGGQLRSYLCGGQVDISPTGGKLVVFPAQLIWHEVLPSWKQRFALTAWLH